MHQQPRCPVTRRRQYPGQGISCCGKQTYVLAVGETAPLRNLESPQLPSLILFPADSLGAPLLSTNMLLQKQLRWRVEPQNDWWYVCSANRRRWILLKKTILLQRRRGMYTRLVWIRLLYCMSGLPRPCIETETCFACAAGFVNLIGAIELHKYKALLPPSGLNGHRK